MMLFSSRSKNQEPPVVVYLSDDTSYLSTARRNLGQAGFSVVTTRSPAELFELFSEQAFDIVLSDYDLPQTDGISLIEEVSARVKRPPPMLIICDREERGVRDRATALGASGVHLKSESLEALIGKVTSLLKDEEKRLYINHQSSRRRFPGGTDPLTRIATRDHFVRRLNGEAAASRRDQTDISLLILLFDKYQEVIEKHGQQKADKAIAQAARLVEGELRSRDCVARYAESTFAVILPETPIDAAASVGRRLRHRVSASEFGDLDLPISLTVSVGASCRPSGVTTSPKDLAISAVNSATAARQMGGNRVVADSALTGAPLVLVVGDPAGEIGPVTRQLDNGKLEVRLATSTEEARQVLETAPVAMVITEQHLAGDLDGCDLLAVVRTQVPRARRVLLAESVDPQLMSAAVNRAAIHHFVQTPTRLDKLAGAVEALLFS